MKDFKFLRNRKDVNNFGAAAIGRVNSCLREKFPIRKLIVFCKDNIKSNKAEIQVFKKYPKIYHLNTWKSREFENEQFQKVVKILSSTR